MLRKTSQLKLDSLTQYIYIDVEGVHVVHLFRKQPDRKSDHIILPFCSESFLLPSLRFDSNNLTN